MATQPVGQSAASGATEPLPVGPQPGASGGEASPDAVPPAAAGDAAGVTRSLSSALAALRQHDLAAAARAFDAAGMAAGEDPELALRVERWRLLLDYTRQLADHLPQAIGSANEGRDYDIGDRTIAIIEIGSTTFAYKDAGQIRRGPRAGLPRPIERAILRGWFDGDPRPANDILLGVHRLLDEAPDLARVRADWQAAAENEPAATAILPLLDDPALAAAD
ncbi:MAG: hypothetical protein ACKO4T_14420 [Planctomycetaceae bacterium]